MQGTSRVNDRPTSSMLKGHVSILTKNVKLSSSVTGCEAEIGRNLGIVTVGTPLLVPILSLCIIVNSEGSAGVKTRVPNQGREKPSGHIVQPFSQFLHQGVHAKFVKKVALSVWGSGRRGGQLGTLKAF